MEVAFFPKGSFESSSSTNFLKSGTSLYSSSPFFNVFLILFMFNIFPNFPEKKSCQIVACKKGTKLFKNKEKKIIKEKESL
jgi:hypothetical protein